MNNFIQCNPEVVAWLIALLGGYAIYLYKRTVSNSAALVAQEMKKLSKAIDTLVTDRRDDRKWVGKLQGEVSNLSRKCESLEATCTERAAHCPVLRRIKEIKHDA